MPQLFAPSTPAKGRQVTGFEAEQKKATETRFDYASITRGQWRGPVDPLAFIEDRFPDALPPGKETAPKVIFDQLVKAGNENDMYGLFMEGFDGVKFPEGVELVVSADKKSGLRELRPDIGMRIALPETRRQTRQHGSIEGPYDDINTALCIELKFNNTDDPFDDWKPDNPDSLFETTSDGARSTRGQLAMYADRQFKHQPRCFLYQVLVVARYARLIYCDRSGNVVTKAFDLIHHPEVLMKFLWRFAHATEKQRGWDETVCMATYHERKALSAAVNKFEAEGSASVPLAIAKVLAERTRNRLYPVCKVLVNADFKTDSQGPLREFLIGAPFHATCATTGRGTRSYLAYDLQDDNFLFLKDTWWISHATTLSETEAYRILEDSKTRYVLTPVCGGLVRDNAGNPQMTLSLDFSMKGLAPPDSSVRKHVHGRVVQKLACSLDGLKSSEELIKVLRDVIQCIKDAYDAGLKHRDVTFANVMFVTTEDSILGILNDWDHAGRTNVSDLGESRAAYFSTTWQFMGIDLLEGKHTEHELIHDLQSVFWVLIYAALHFCKHDNPLFLNGNNVFDEKSEVVTPDLEVLVRGGAKKRSLLLGTTLSDFPFKCPPLKTLIAELSKHWRRYETLKTMLDFEDDVEKFSQCRAYLESPDWWIAKLNHALEQPGWLPDDIVPDQCPPRTARQASRLIAVAAAAKKTSSSERKQLIAENSSSLVRIHRKTSRAGLSTGRHSKRKAEEASGSTTNARPRKKAKAA